MNTVEVCTSMLRTDAAGEYDEDVVLVVSIDYYNYVKGSYSYNAPSDLDYYGYEEIDYTVVEVYVDNGKMDTKVPFDPEVFNNENDIERIESIIRAEMED